MFPKAASIDLKSHGKRLFVAIKIEKNDPEMPEKV